MCGPLLPSSRLQTRCKHDGSFWYISIFGQTLAPSAVGANFAGMRWRALLLDAQLTGAWPSSRMLLNAHLGAAAACKAILCFCIVLCVALSTEATITAVPLHRSNNHCRTPKKVVPAFFAPLLFHFSLPAYLDKTANDEQMFP